MLLGLLLVTAQADPPVYPDEPTTTLDLGQRDGAPTLVRHWTEELGELHNDRVVLTWGDDEQVVFESGTMGLRVSRDGDSVLLVTSGSRYDEDGLAVYTRYRWDPDRHVLYEAETWRTSAWAERDRQMRQALERGAFDDAVGFADCSTSGGWDHVGDTVNAAFLAAHHREAMRAWQAGRTGAAGALAAAFLDHAPCGFATEHEGLVGVPRAASSPDAIAVAPSATVVAQLNDLGFFLTESGDAERGLSVLELVTTLAPDRTVAWLNQADAAWASGDKGLARASYRTYVDRLEDAGGTAVPRATKRAARR